MDYSEIKSNPALADSSHTYFALLSVQIELMLADSHDPDGFDQRMAGIPRVDE